VQTLKDEISQSKKQAAEAQEKLAEKEATLEASTRRVCQSLVYNKCLVDCDGVD
jgi:hypothetical protein